MIEELQVNERLMTQIAYATRRVDPFNWIRRLRDFNQEKNPPRMSDEELNRIIVAVHKMPDPFAKRGRKS